MKKAITRSEQKIADTWNLEAIYKNIDIYNEEYQTVLEDIKKLEVYENKILDSDDNLYMTLFLSIEIERKLNKLGNYAYRKNDQDVSNQETQTLKGDIDRLYSLYNEKTAFVIPEILKGDWSLIQKYIGKNSKLENFSLQLERIFRKKEYTLSNDEEKILAALSVPLNSSSDIAGIVRNSELQFGFILDENGNKVEINNENLSIYLRNPERRVRKDAFESIYSTYRKNIQTLAASLNGDINSRSIVNRLRGFKSSKEASLFSNRVNPKVYDILVKTINDRMDTIYNYFKLIRDTLKLSDNDFSIYDTYINLTEGPVKSYSFDEAKEIVLDVVSVFGDDYVNTVERAFNERWIDIYPNKGKRGGAYSSGSYDTYPYILLNFQGDYHDVSTLIHELGHSMHTYYSNRENLPQYSDYKIFVAEVASNVNEMLLSYHMLEKATTNEEKKYILSEMMSMFKATMYRQTMFSEFEEMMYSECEKGTYLTSKVLCDKYYDLNKKYYGDGVVVNEEIKYEWARVPHFYYNFYTYQYATGLASACYIVDRIRNGEETAVDDYLKFLKSGDSMDPLEELKLAGVDLLDPDVINQAIDMFDDLIKKFRELL